MRVSGRGKNRRILRWSGAAVVVVVVEIIGGDNNLSNDK